MPTYHTYHKTMNSLSLRLCVYQGQITAVRRSVRRRLLLLLLWVLGLTSSRGELSLVRLPLLHLLPILLPLTTLLCAQVSDCRLSRSTWTNLRSAGHRRRLVPGRSLLAAVEVAADAAAVDAPGAAGANVHMGRSQLSRIRTGANRQTHRDI